MKSKDLRDLAAHVFLRSVSGRSIRELGQTASPANLSPYLPPQEARDKVCRTFEKRGFRVFLDDTGLTVSIEGPLSLFARVFNVGEKSLLKVSASETVSLQPPKEVRDLVEEIVLVPAPEFFTQ